MNYFTLIQDKKKTLHVNRSEYLNTFTLSQMRSLEIMFLLKSMSNVYVITVHAEKKKNEFIGIQFPQ